MRDWSNLLPQIFSAKKCVTGHMNGPKERREEGREAKMGRVEREGGREGSRRDAIREEREGGWEEGNTRLTPALHAGSS